MRILAKLINITATLLTILAIISAGVLFLPRLFGYTPYAVMSGSMDPEIKAGSLVFIDTGNKKAETGDVIAYHAMDDAVETQRVYAYDKNTASYITRGDADINSKTSIPKDQVIGTYVKSIPEAGYLFSLLSHQKANIKGFEIPAGPLITILLLILINIFAAVISWIAERRQDDGTEEEEMPDDAKYSYL